MKPIASLLIALALANTVYAGLPTDPLSGTPQPPLDHPIHPGAPQPVLVPNHPSPTALPPVHLNVQAAGAFLAQVVGSLPADGTLRLSDLFMNPEFFAAAHAAGPQADALRGQIDWLMLSGVILGLDGDDGLDDFDGMDGSDDLRGSDDPDEIAAQTNPAENGFVFGTTSYLNEPINNGFVFGTTSYVNEPVTNGFIYGQSAYVKGQTTSNGFVFGEVVYLAGDSQDHNPDISND